VKRKVSRFLTSHNEGNEVIFDKMYLKCARVAMLRVRVLIYSFTGKKDISEGQHVLVTCKSNILNQLIIILN
jgi:hypothetical protein